MYLNGFLGNTEADIDNVELGDSELDYVIEEVGSLERGNPKRKAFKSRMRRNFKPAAVVSTNNLTSKAEFEKRFQQLPEDIKKGLLSGKLQLIDAALYAIKDISTLNALELLANADDKTTGKVNINGRKLDANTWFLLTGITLQTGTFTAVPADASFGVPAAAVLNGEFSLELGNKVLIDQISCAVFDTTGRTDVQKGYFKLENPKMLSPQTEIVPEVRLPAAAAANTAIKLILHGAMVAKA